MTLLSHFSDPLPDRSPSLRAHRHAGGAASPVHAGVANARFASIGRLFAIACTVLLAMGALTGIIALKTAIYLSHFNY